LRQHTSRVAHRTRMCDGQRLAHVRSIKIL